MVPDASNFLKMIVTIIWAYILPMASMTTPSVEATAQPLRDPLRGKAGVIKESGHLYKAEKAPTGL